VSPSAADRRIRSLRPPRQRFDPYAAHGSIVETERRPDGGIERALTVFLAGAECRFTCSFCDLWRWTIDGPTEPGALTKQLKGVLDSLEGPPLDRLKFYNASNFFDPRAVPTEDVSEIAKMSAGFGAVTVESHANTIGPTALAFARQIPGKLEVAVGLETIHPIAATNLNKRLDLARFDRAAAFLAENEIDLRVFVLLGAPYVDIDESVEWTLRTVEYAVARGAAIVSIIPVRGGNGELERLEALGHFVPPTLSQLEDALDGCLQFESAVVTADVWDAERLSACEHCKAKRIERLQFMNVTGHAQQRIGCDWCRA
jgi:archaeosine synthase beta-subunit